MEADYTLIVHVLNKQTKETEGKNSSRYSEAAYFFEPALPRSDQYIHTLHTYFIA